MKTKIVLFVAAAITLFSFTVVSRSKQNVPAAQQATTEQPAPQGGFAMEDKDQWK
jgi:hypothetical protein